jgi:hypothetical protein
MFPLMYSAEKEELLRENQKKIVNKFTREKERFTF